MEISKEVLHNRLLSMMNAFHYFCEHNNIHYYLVGGSALGAKRHQGFIPWDDDMDIGIPRDDYERLLEMEPHCLPEGLEIRFYKNTYESPFHFIKLVDKNSTLIERQYQNYIEGIYIDIFPLDGANETSFFENIRRSLIWYTHTYLILHYFTGKKSNPIKKAVQMFAQITPSGLIHELLEKQMLWYSYSNSEYVANYLGSWKEREIMPKYYLGKPTLYNFEGIELFGPENIDMYLHSLYGDYMKLPPKDKRVFKHDYYYINVDLPYREYIEQMSN